MDTKSVVLVFGGTGRTGRHFLSMALDAGHAVRALVRNPDDVTIRNPSLELHKGSITDDIDLDGLLQGANLVISMLGNAKLQRNNNVNTAFVRRLIPTMRRQGVKRFLYQAGGLTRRYKEPLPLTSWLVKNTFAQFSGLLGQHRDNEAVIAYLVEQAEDIEWMVHRASIVSDGPSKGILQRSRNRASLATFGDCAAYNLRTLKDDRAIHTYDLSCYS